MNLPNKCMYICITDELRITRVAFRQWTYEEYRISNRTKQLKWIKSKRWFPSFESCLKGLIDEYVDLQVLKEAYLDYKDYNKALNEILLNIKDNLQLKIKEEF